MKTEPTEAEKRHGWTAETLTAYLTEREAAQGQAVDINSIQRQRKPRLQNHKYNPKRWRG